MRVLLGTDWTPLNALLEGAMALAVDDLTSTPELQNPSIFEAWNLLPPAATLRTGKGATFAGQARGVNFGYFRVEETGRGGSYRVRTSQESGVYWVVARTR